MSDIGLCWLPQMRLLFWPWLLVSIGRLTAAAKLKGGGTRAAGQRRTRLIGYYDAQAQRELPVDAVEHRELTHVVLTNAVSVASNGTLVYRSAAGREELSAAALIQRLAALPATRLVVSLRGYPDDVAFDELAEVDDVRSRFVENVTALLQGWNASGLEIEWHADDVSGGKVASVPFDVMEQYHFALLCRDLSVSLHAAGGKTLSVAARPGLQEFADGNFVRGYINWLSVQAYSMRSLGDPHHASLKDMEAALNEWTEKGVPKSQLVLGTPLFARPGSALHSAGDRNEGLRRPWSEIVKTSLVQPSSLLQERQDRRHFRNGVLVPEELQATTTTADLFGDRFVDAASGKVWWASGINTTRAKMQHVLRSGYGGLALRDLHWDAADSDYSLAQVAREAELDFRRQEAERRRQRLAPTAMQTPVLFQRGMGLSKVATLDGKHDEF